MNLLSLIGNVASIFGLVISIYTLIKVNNLPATLEQQSRDRQLDELIKLLDKSPSSKQKMTDSNVRDVQTIVSTIRLYDVLKIPFVHSKRKKLLQALELELEGAKQLSVVLKRLQAIQTEIAIR